MGFSQGGVGCSQGGVGCSQGEVGYSQEGVGYVQGEVGYSQEGVGTVQKKWVQSGRSGVQSRRSRHYLFAVWLHMVPTPWRKDMEQGKVPVCPSQGLRVYRLRSWGAQGSSD